MVSLILPAGFPVHSQDSGLWNISEWGMVLFTCNQEKCFLKSDGAHDIQSFSVQSMNLLRTKHQIFQFLKKVQLIRASVRLPHSIQHWNTRAKPGVYSKEPLVHATSNLAATL